MRMLTQEHGLCDLRERLKESNMSKMRNIKLIDKIRIELIDMQTADTMHTGKGIEGKHGYLWDVTNIIHLILSLSFK